MKSNKLQSLIVNRKVEAIVKKIAKKLDEKEKA